MGTSELEHATRSQTSRTTADNPTRRIFDMRLQQTGRAKHSPDERLRHVVRPLRTRMSVIVRVEGIHSSRAQQLELIRRKLAVIHEFGCRKTRSRRISRGSEATGRVYEFASLPWIVGGGRGEDDSCA